MTEKTDIAALRERLVELNRTYALVSSVPTRKWADDAAHSFIKSGGINLILEKLDQLEAERQRADAAEQHLQLKYKIENKRIDIGINNEKRISELEAELAALRGTQEPVTMDAMRDAVAEMSGGLPMDWRETTAKGHHGVPFINFNSLHRIVTKFTLQPKPVVVHPDTVRMDWLCAHVVQVRQPMFYGSHAMFFGQCDSADDEEYHSKLREQIDAEIEAAGIVVKSSE